MSTNLVKYISQDFPYGFKLSQFVDDLLSSIIRNKLILVTWPNMEDIIYIALSASLDEDELFELNNIIYNFIPRCDPQTYYYKEYLEPINISTTSEELLFMFENLRHCCRTYKLEWSLEGMYSDTLNDKSQQDIYGSCLSIVVKIGEDIIAETSFDYPMYKSTSGIYIINDYDGGSNNSISIYGSINNFGSDYSDSYDSNLGSFGSVKNIQVILTMLE